MKRIITGMIAGAMWLLLLFSGSFLLFGLVIALIGIIAMFEYSGIIAQPGPKNEKFVAIVAGMLPLLAALSGRAEMVTASVFVSLVIVIGATLVRYSAINNPFEHMAKLSFGLLLIGFSSAHLTMIMARPQGYLWLLMLTAVTVASDTCAYYTGSLLGKTKLCPAVSPGKTVEGFVGGLVGGVIAALMVTLYFLPAFNLWLIALVAALLSCVGVMGDLTESVIKRSAGVKDSGAILPGHGGVLDRIDSLLLSAPILYYMLNLNILASMPIK